MTTTMKPPLRRPKNQDREPAFPNGQRVKKVGEGTDCGFFSDDIKAEKVAQENGPHATAFGFAPIGTKGTLVPNETGAGPLRKGAVLVRFDSGHFEAYSPIDALCCLEPIEE